SAPSWPGPARLAGSLPDASLYFLVCTSCLDRKPYGFQRRGSTGVSLFRRSGGNSLAFRSRGGMLFLDKDVARTREHRPLSRGSRTAPSPTRVVLRSGPYRVSGTGPALLLSMRNHTCSDEHFPGSIDP